MLITCNKCETKFSVEIRCSPVCRTVVELSPEQQEQVWQERSERLIMEGYDRRRVIENLIQDGVADSVAQRIYEAARASTTRVSPQDRGQQLTNMIIAGGVGSLGLAAAVMLFSITPMLGLIPLIAVGMFFGKRWFVRSLVRRDD